MKSKYAYRGWINYWFWPVYGLEGNKRKARLTLTACFDPELYDPVYPVFLYRYTENLCL